MAGEAWVERERESPIFKYCEDQTDQDSATQTKLLCNTWGTDVNSALGITSDKSQRRGGQSFLLQIFALSTAEKR